MNSDTSPPAKGINRLSVGGFKSLSNKTEIEIRPLTILAGANSSGKSSIMQPLLMMKQTLDASYDPGPLLLDGPNVKYTATDQFLSKINHRDALSEFTVGVGIDGTRHCEVLFKAQARRGVTVQKATYTHGSDSFTLTPKMSRTEIEQLLPKEVLSRTKELFGSKRLQSRVARDRCFLIFELFRRLSGSFVRVAGVSPFDADPIREIIHLSGLRGVPERTYPVTAVEPIFQGTFESYFASVIVHWQRNWKLHGKRDQLADYMASLGLTSDVKARPQSDTRVEVLVSRSKETGETNDMVSVADVGLGVSQTLPVIVALLVAKPGQLVYLEQPEIHLHPRAQYALARVLSDAVVRGVRVVVETHSSLLLLGIQSEVAAAHLPHSQVKLHWFTNNDGKTEISSRDLDGVGRFGDWPVDFADVTLSAQKGYLEAAELRLFEETKNGS